MMVLPLWCVCVCVVSLVVTFVFLTGFNPLDHLYLALEPVRVRYLEAKLFVFDHLLVNAGSFCVHEVKFILFERRFNVLTDTFSCLHNYFVVFNDFSFVFPNQD